MWTFEKASYNKADTLLNESLYALGNGYLGVRGCLEEQPTPSIRGTYINGFYDESQLVYSEKLFGFPDHSERMLNVVETQTMLIILDDEQVILSEERLSNYQRSLNLKQGYGLRRYTYMTDSGKKAEICFRRVVSFTDSTLFAIDLDIKYEGDIQVLSYVDGDVTTYADDHDPRVGSHRERLLHVTNLKIKHNQLFLEASTQASGLTMKVSCCHQTTASQSHEQLTYGFKTILKSKNTMHVTKYNRYEMNEVVTETKDWMSFEALLTDQENYLNDFWEHSDIKISGDKKLQQGLRFNLFHLLQSCGRDGKRNIAAKGLTGEGYEGHTFWDTEIYMLPSFLYNQSSISRALLINRYAQLEKGRLRARTLGHKRGVKFPWRTITGQECSSYFPAGTAQYHINGDIAYGVMQYYFMTNDDEFMACYGHEMILETALLWLEMGHFYEGTFRIDAVTGPDEYSCVVNNNYYTNALAQFNMKWAYALKGSYDKTLLMSLNVTKEDFELFKRASENMYLPYDDVLDIHLQDDHFLEKKPWDFDNTPKDKYPLLLHYHPLTIYRYQVLKQADTVLAHLLMPGGISKETMLSTYEYYKNITTHDSSLSACVYGMMASRLNKMDEALAFFYETIYLDVDDMHGNTKDGLHMANLAGSILSIYKGFLGIHLDGDYLYFAPKVPKEFGELEVKLIIKGRKLQVMVSEEMTITLLEGQPIDLVVNETVYRLEDTLNLEVCHD